jgi:hypothetical protein
VKIDKEEIELPKRSIPSSISYQPGNFDDAAEIQEEIETLIEEPGESSTTGESPAAQTDKKEFAIHATTNRGSGAVYRDGEEMVIRFFSNTDAYVKVYHIDVYGNTSLIFPNRFQSNNFIKGGEMQEIPREEDPFRFQLHEPFGTEFIKVVASSKQFRDIEDDFENLGGASRSLLSRGLSVTGTAAATAEVLINYTIVE